MSKRTILIVPPRGIPVKSIRIRFSVAVIFIVFVLSGFLGYFIPFEKITLNEIEKNQKKNLTEQNNALLQKILASLRLLNSLKEQVDRLELKKSGISKESYTDTIRRNAYKKNIDVDKTEADALVAFIDDQEGLIETFLSGTSDTVNIFDVLPVITPVSEPYVISRVFGVSTDPFTGTEKWHYGIDFVAEMESFVFATADGVVDKVENHPVWGKRVSINHGSGVITTYAHLGAYKVNMGKKIVRGDVIGTIGTSGLSTGPHLHYEIKVDGTFVDPIAYIFPTITSKFTFNLQ